MFVAKLAEVAAEWDEAMRQAASMQWEKHAVEEAVADAFGEAWSGYWLPDDWRSSLVAMARRGLSVDDARRLVVYVLNRPRIDAAISILLWMRLELSP